MNPLCAMPIFRAVIRLLFILAVLGGAAGATARAGEPEWVSLSRDEQIAALELVSAEIQHNHARLRTWSGSYVLDEASRLTGQTAGRLARQLDPEASTEGVVYFKLDHALCEFVIDLEADSIFSALREDGPPKLVDAHSGEPIDIDLWASFQKSIITPGEFLKFQPARLQVVFDDFAQSRESGPKSRGRVAFRDRPETGKRQLSSIVLDPRTFLFDYPATDSMGRFARMLKAGDPENVRRTRSIDFQVAQATADGRTLFKVNYHSPIADGTEIAVERIFSEGAGYNPIDESLFALPARTLAQRFEWAYDQIDGIYIPRMHRRRFLTIDGVTTRFDRTCTLVNATLNNPVPPKTFTVAQLGLEEGDRLMDNIAGKLTVYRKGELVDPNSVSEAAGRLWKAVLFSFPAALLVLARMVHRRRRAKLSSA